MELSDSGRSSREKSKNNLKMNLVLQGYFWPLRPLIPLLWSLFCSNMNLLCVLVKNRIPHNDRSHVSSISKYCLI